MNARAWFSHHQACPRHNGIAQIDRESIFEWIYDKKKRTRACRVKCVLWAEKIHFMQMNGVHTYTHIMKEADTHFSHSNLYSFERCSEIFVWASRELCISERMQVSERWCWMLEWRISSRLMTARGKSRLLSASTLGQAAFVLFAPFCSPATFTSHPMMVKNLLAASALEWIAVETKIKYTMRSAFYLRQMRENYILLGRWCAPPMYTGAFARRTATLPAHTLSKLASCCDYLSRELPRENSMPSPSVRRLTLNLGPTRKKQQVCCTRLYSLALQHQVEFWYVHVCTWIALFQWNIWCDEIIWC